MMRMMLWKASVKKNLNRLLSLENSWNTVVVVRRMVYLK